LEALRQAKGLGSLSGVEWLMLARSSVEIFKVSE
jgi:hypothetical protein